MCGGSPSIVSVNPRAEAEMELKERERILLLAMGPSDVPAGDDVLFPSM